MPRPHASLRRALLAWLLLPLLGLVPLAASLLYLLAVRPALDSLDRALTDTAVALGELIEVRDGRPVLELSEQTARALRADLLDEVAFAVGDPDARLLAGDEALLAMRPALAAGQWQFFDGLLHGHEVRAAAVGVVCGVPARVCPVLVAESLGKRSAAQRAVALAATAAALLLALSLGLLALLAVHRGLRPLQRASAEVATRSLQRLEPVAVDAMPREVASFVVAINDLFARLREAAAVQRAFVADASHQLRTPLATLLSESAQALAQPHPPALTPTLERLHEAAARGARLVQQLLTLARTEGAPTDALGPRSRIDLAALAADAADDWLRPARAAGQDLGFDLEPAAVQGHALLLRELLDNLVLNAAAHAGRGARVTVRTRCDGAQALLEVEDDGPGVAADELPRLGGRFRRGRDARGIGSGLGLAIVRDIARLHGGQAQLQPGPGGRGLTVRVTLPAAAD